MSLRRTFLISTAVIFLGSASYAQDSDSRRFLEIQTNTGMTNPSTNLNALQRFQPFGPFGNRIVSSADSRALLTGQLPQNRSSGIQTVTISPEGPPNGESVITSSIPSFVARLNREPDQAQETGWSAQQDIADHLAAVQQAQSLSSPFGVYNLVEGASPSNPVTPQNVIGRPADAGADDPEIATLPASQPSSISPGLYVHVIDGTINLTNRGGTQNFAAGQFGFTNFTMQPPVVLPANPGIVFSPPPFFTPAKGASSYAQTPSNLPVIEFFSPDAGLVNPSTSMSTAPLTNTPTPPPSGLSNLIEVSRPIPDLTNYLAREIEALRQVVATDAQALTQAIGPALDRLKGIARRSPEGIAAFPGLAADLLSATTAALDSWVSVPEIRTALTVALAQAIIGEISQLSNQVPPDVLAQALVSVAKTLTDHVATSLTGPSPEIAAVFDLIADTIPSGLQTDAVAAIRDISEAVATGDLGKIKGTDLGGPKSASEN